MARSLGPILVTTALSVASLAACTDSTMTGSPMGDCPPGHEIRESAFQGIQRYCFDVATMQADGPYRWLYEDGQLHAAGMLKAGVPDGDWLLLSIHGTVTQSWSLVDGLIDGELAMFFEDGQPRAIRRYHAGVPCGLAVEWDMGGNELVRVDLGACDAMTTPPPTPTPPPPAGMPLDCGAGHTLVGDPPPMGNAQWCESAGAHDGAFESYYEDGGVRERSTYAAGVLDGAFESFYPSGATSERGSYAAGARDGMWVSFWESGLPEDSGAYSAGVREGTHSRFAANGAPEWTSTYSMGLREGPSLRYHENGELQEDATYRHDRAEGRYRLYYVNGVLALEAMALDGDFEGDVLEWYPDGRIAAQVPYVRGCRERIGRHWAYPDSGPYELQEVPYRDCTANGVARIYVANAADELRFAGELEYVRDLAEGPFYLVYESGRRQVDGGFAGGRPDGLWRLYADDDAGSVIGECRYGLGIPLADMCMSMVAPMSSIETSSPGTP